MKTYANFKQKLIKVFCFRLYSLIEFQIRIFDKMLLPKHSVSFEGR